MIGSYPMSCRKLCYILRKWKDNQVRAKAVRQSGIKPGSIAWTPTMLTFTPPSVANCGKWDREVLHFLQNQQLLTMGMGRGLSVKEIAKLISAPFPTKLKTEYLLSKCWILSWWAGISTVFLKWQTYTLVKVWLLASTMPSIVYIHQRLFIHSNALGRQRTTTHH